MIEKRLSQLSPTTMKLALQLCRAINGHNEIRKAGLMAHIFETKRTQERQNELFKQGKSWVKRSTHQNGSAFDLVLVYKAFKPLRITRFFWDSSSHYKIIQKLAHNLGLYSYGLVYNQDAFHFELPLIWQPESDCFAYAVVNALRWNDAAWRMYGKAEAKDFAEVLQRDTTKKYNLKGVLEAAEAKGWIKGFKQIDISDATNDMCCVCQTKHTYLGDDKWDKINEMVRQGRGIPSHSTAIGKITKKGVVILNSHYNLAEYVIEDTSYIYRTYQIFLKQ